MEKWIIIVLALLVTVGCTETGQITITPSQGTYKEVALDISKDVKTKQFSSENELSNFIKQNSGGSSNYYGTMAGGAGGIRKDMVVTTAAEDFSVAAPKVSGDAADYSQTNVQVTGVDEGDIIKTDGEYIYTVSENVLFIIKAYPGEDSEIVTQMKFDNRPEGLFIEGDKMAVFGNFYNNDYFKEINFIPRYGMTYLNIYDISDKAKPELLKEYKFEGSYFRSRMANGYMYLITSSPPEVRPMPMPYIMEGNVKSNVPVKDIYYYDIQYQNPLFVNIHAISLDNTDEAISSKTIAVEGSQDMYMSESNIYITYTEYINEYDIQRQVIMELLEPKLTDADKQLIERIKQTDNDVLSNQEKQDKIYQVYETYASYLTSDEQDALQKDAESLLQKRLEEYEYFEYTVINKINIFASDISATANGKVPGHVNNQFSMDEQDGILRIATTVDPRWSSVGKQTKESVNNVYTLDENLEVLDKLEGLAAGETIFSTRFIGDRLYMVTFRQVDPFFVIDLSNPSNIKELGQLKIPGFSRYLHPYDKDTIIGIGKDATESGTQGGLKVSLFDVSDVEHPKEIAKYVAEAKYSDSTALWEHKAFLFSKEKNLLVIPAYSYNWEDSTQNYNGAFVFNISKEGIELRGLIDHSKGVQGQYYSPAVERSLYIDNMLYTKSLGLLRINDLQDLSTVKNIDLKYTSPDIKVY